MSEFYDEAWFSLQRQLPLVARKIEHCYELCLGYSQYETEKEEMMQHLEVLTKEVEKALDRIEKLEAALEAGCQAALKKEK